MGNFAVGTSPDRMDVFLSPLPVPDHVRVSITGTPGTGKSTVGAILSREGHTVVELGSIIKEHRLYEGRDEERDTLEVDPEVLRKRVPGLLPDGDVILIGHLSHLVDADIIVVLRCRPSVLERRLDIRGWGQLKVRENVEAEALDVILIEAVETGHDVLEVDTTDLTPVQAKDAVEEILAGERSKYMIGNVDWSQEVLGWY